MSRSDKPAKFVSSPRAVVVLVTCPTTAVAKRLAKHVVADQLAACVNIVPQVESWFRWEGRVERAREVLLLVKTTASGFEPLRKAILKLHPYDLPEIIALPIVSGHAPYLAWVGQSISRRASS